MRQEPNPIEQKGFRDYVEEQIQEAMAKGKFNNLPGKGKPLRLGQENPGHPRRAERIEELNLIIDKFNLEVPAGRMQKPRYRD